MRGVIAVVAMMSLFLLYRKVLKSENIGYND